MLKWCQNIYVDKIGKKISIMVSNMENGIEVYFVLLGRLSLKQAKIHHSWGDNTLTIISTLTFWVLRFAFMIMY